MALRVSDLDEDLRRQILAEVKASMGPAYDEWIARHGEDSLLKGVLETVASGNQSLPIVKTLKPLIERAERPASDDESDGEVGSILFFSIFIGGAIATAIFGFKETSSEHDRLNGLVVMCCFVGAGWLSSRIGAMYSAITGALIWMIAAFGVWNSVAYTSGGIAAWWKWFTGHFV